MTLSIYRPTRLAEAVLRPMRLAEAMNRLLDESLARSYGVDESAYTLPLDVLAHEDEFVVTAAIPGIKPEDVRVDVLGNTLTISAEWPAPALPDKAAWMVQERPFGKVTRTITFPVELNGSQAEARVEHGVLTLRLPKAEAAKPKSIKVITR